MQILHVPMKVLALDPEDNVSALGTSCLIRETLCTWGLGTHQIVSADNVIYGGGLGSGSRTLASGGAGG